MGCGFSGEWGGIFGLEGIWRGVGGEGLYTIAALAVQAALAELGICGDLRVGGLRLECCQVFGNLDLGLCC